MPGEFRGDVPMDVLDIGQREIAAADTGLICHHDQRISRPGEPLKRFNNAWVKMHFFRFVQIFSLLDQSSIAVQKNGAFHRLLLKLSTNSSGLTVAVPT